MKSFRLCLLSFAVITLTASLPAQPKTTPVIKTIETARIAFVSSSQFLDETTGLKELVRVSKALEVEFSSTQGDLSLLNEKLRTIAGEITRLRADPVANAKALEEKQTAGFKLQQELQGKQQQAQATFQQRQQETQGPITAQIGKELRTFAKERDVSMLLDASKLGDALLDAKLELDLTPDFIAYYNGKHP